MDDLHNKFTSLISRAANTASKFSRKRFSGQGHRLGTAKEHMQESKQATKQPGQPTEDLHNPSHGPRGAGWSARLPPTPAAAGPGLAQRQQQEALPPAPVTGGQLLQATEFDGFTAVTGSGAALGANRSASSAAGRDAVNSSYAATAVPANPPPTHSTLCHDRSSIPQSAEQLQQQLRCDPVTAEHVEELQHCLALIVSQPAVAGGTIEILVKLLTNLTAAPQEVKYRHINLSNPKIKQYVVQVSGALEFLATVGFLVHVSADEAAATATAGIVRGGTAVFMADSQLGVVHEGIRQLQVLPAGHGAQQQQQQQADAVPFSKLATDSITELILQPADPVHRSHPTLSAIPAAQSALPHPATTTRKTQVLLPAVSDNAVPDWFFERTGAEVKAEYMALLRARQNSKVLASKSWGNAQPATRAGTSRTEACVRVRFPEGVCLQGCFHVSEPVSAVVEWVREALRNPTVQFALIKPNKKPLTAEGHIGDADLAPAVLLNFRPLTELQQISIDSNKPLSFLKDARLMQGQRLQNVEHNCCRLVALVMALAFKGNHASRTECCAAKHDDLPQHAIANAVGSPNVSVGGVSTAVFVGSSHYGTCTVVTAPPRL